MLRNKGKILTAVLAVMMALTIVACGGKAGEGKDLKNNVISSTIGSTASNDSASKSDQQTASESSSIISSEKISTEVNNDDENEDKNEDEDNNASSASEKSDERPERIDFEDGSYWIIEYTPDGKLAQEKRYESTGYYPYSIVTYDENERAVSETYYQNETVATGKLHSLEEAKTSSRIFEYDSDNNYIGYILKGKFEDSIADYYSTSLDAEWPERKIYTNVESISYDESGRVKEIEYSEPVSDVFKEYKHKVIFKFSYDEDNRIIYSIREDYGTDYGDTYLNNKKDIIQRKREYSYEYDSLGRPIKRNCVIDSEYWKGELYSTEENAYYTWFKYFSYCGLWWAQKETPGNDSYGTNYSFLHDSWNYYEFEKMPGFPMVWDDFYEVYCYDMYDGAKRYR